MNLVVVEKVEVIEALWNFCSFSLEKYFIHGAFDFRPQSPDIWRVFGVWKTESVQNLLSFYFVLSKWEQIQDLCQNCVRSRGIAWTMSHLTSVFLRINFTSISKHSKILQQTNHKNSFVQIKSPFKFRICLH